jgi:hypothetical protein
VSRAGWAGTLACALVACAPAAPASPKVLVLGIDGVRPDRLADAHTPTLDSLIAQGAYSDRALTRPPTVSGPGWSSMLIGVWSEKHGVLGNDFTTNAYPRYPDFLTRIEQVRPDLATLAILDWPPLATTAAGGPLISDRVDRKLLFDGDSLGYGPADSLSAARAADLLATSDVDAAFVYLGDVDEVGHAHGSFSPEYRAALETADGQVRQVLDGATTAATAARPTWSGPSSCSPAAPPSGPAASTLHPRSWTSPSPPSRTSAFRPTLAGGSTGT